MGRDLNQKMENGKLDTYAKFFKNEPKTAAYLGYHEVGAFRKFCFSGTVLEWFLMLQQHCQNLNPKVPIQVVSDITNHVETFGTNAQESVDKYPLTNIQNRTSRQEFKHHREWIHAGVLYHLMVAIERLPTMSHQELHAKQVTFSDKFEMEYKSHGFRIPSCDPTTVLFPVLGPRTELGEDVGEKYSRVNALLKSSQCVVAPTKWKETFVTLKGDPYHDTLISSDAIPTWIQPANADDVIPGGVLDKTREVVRGKKTFLLSLDRTAVTKFAQRLDEHIKRHIIYNSLRLPEQMVRADKDPRAYPRR